MLDADQLRFVTDGPLAATRAGGCQNTVPMPGAGPASSRLGHPLDMETGRRPGAWRVRRRGRALPEDRRRPGGCRAGRRCRFRARTGRANRGDTPGTALPAGPVLPARTPALRAVLDGLAAWACWSSMACRSGPRGRPGLGAHAHAEFGIPVIGVAKSRFRTATHAVPVVRRSSVRPLFVTAAGIPSADAADLVRRMAGRTGCPTPCAAPIPLRGQARPQSA